MKKENWMSWIARTCVALSFGLLISACQKNSEPQGVPPVLEGGPRVEAKRIVLTAKQTESLRALLQSRMESIERAPATCREECQSVYSSVSRAILLARSLSENQREFGLEEPVSEYENFAEIYAAFFPLRPELNK